MTQLREGLRGRLRELHVPLRNDLLTWQGARAHVIRLASTLGAELGRPFVIVIDGIDHAARAAQTMPQQSAEFFASLPGPDELRGKSVRLLVAGQPAESYSAQYPNWLVASHPEVRKIELPSLQADDVRSLVRAVSSKIPAEQLEEVVRLIQEMAKGNTLATVFAVAEAEKVTSLDELTSRLADRRLSDGLAAYYSSIWQHALRGLADLTEGVGACLVTSLSLARRGVTPEFLAAAFGEWSRPAGWWAALLEDLGPLLTAGPDGYRVRHNDVRVFLAGRFAALPPVRRRRVVSQLAEHYGRPDCDRVAAHLQLLDLLKLADRPDDFSRAFDVGWVFEAGTLGIETAQLLTECEAAIQGLARLKEWPLVVSVACAAQTLERLIEARERADYAAHDREELPPFLPSEARVRALSQWSLPHLRSLVHDAERLVEADEGPRALALLRRWLEGLDLDQVVGLLGDGLADQFKLSGQEARLSQEAVSVFESLGRLCRRLEWVLPQGQSAASLYQHSLLVFERGYVAAALQSKAATLSGLFAGYRPRYLGSWESALRGLAGVKRWVLVRKVLAYLQAGRLSLGAPLRAEVTAWALRSGAAKDEPAWLAPINEPAFGIDPKEAFSYEPREMIAPYLSVAYSLGWTRVGMDPRDVAASVYQQFDPNGRYEDWQAAALAVFRACALLGRIDAAFARGGDEEARQLLTPSQVREVLGSLWGRVVTANFRFRHRDTAAELAGSIADVCERLGGEYDAAALEQATVFAAEFPIDARRPALWHLLRRHGEREVLRRWVVNWIADEGRAWRLSHEEVHSVVRPLLPLAEELGESDLAQRAAGRLRGLLIGYWSHKDYGFAHVLEWFRAASRADPALWRTVGWKVWHLCDLCEQRDADNRLQGALRTSVSAAALGCGPADWWALIQATAASGLGGYWYDRTGQGLLEGVTEAVDSGRTFPCGDLPVIWSLSLAFSYWHDEADNSTLRLFREALLRIPGTAPERQPLLDALGRTSRSNSLERPPAKDEGPNPLLEDASTAAGIVSSVNQEIGQGKLILPSAAAAVVRALAASSSADRDGQIDAVLMAIGDESVADWSHADTDVLSSLEEIARAVTDVHLWLIARAIAKGMNHSRPYRIYGVYPNLFRLALARAEARGTGELAAGLVPQLEMHARWAGSERLGNHDWPPLPSVEEELTWQALAVRLLGVLLNSYSSDLLAAALEGTHALAAARSWVIADLFAECSTEWQRHWLLSAAESWAALQPAGVSAARPLLDRLLAEGSLLERLQSWLVLNRLSETSGCDRPDFPLRATTGDPPRGGLIVPGGLLHSLGVPHGHVRLSDAYSSARRVLTSLQACGWDFERLEPEIGTLLSDGPADESHSVKVGPRRRNDGTCHDLRVETVVGGAILRTLTVSTCDQEDVPFLAQGFLGSDDAWLQRSPPRPASASALWASSRRHGAEEPRDEEVQAALRSVALSLDVAPGWRTFTARVFDCTWKRDYVLYLWHEQCLSGGLLTRGDRPSCPSGRTFVWWMDDFFEPPTPGTSFVSGFFVGGGQRLGHDILHIQPSRDWREILGWTIDRADPLTWRLRGEPIARYERLHGPLQRAADAPGQRQPVIDRWVITDGALAQVQSAVGLLRMREEFSSVTFE